MSVLPPELIANILEHLDLPSLLLCRTVSSTFHNLIEASITFQYKIELAISGQEDGGHYTVATRRTMLKQHQAAWDDLQWTRDRRVPMFHGGLWELYGNVLAQNSPDRATLYFKQLPSQCRGVEERDWTIDVRSYRLRDFGMDPAQNLLILVEHPRWLQNVDHNYRIYLRTLSTGEPHPLAAKPRVLIHEQRIMDRVSYSIQTCGDTLGILFDSREVGETEAVLWNWKTGQVLANIVSDDIKSMAFLSERYLILATLRLSDTLDELEPTLTAVDFVATPPQRRRLDELESIFTFCFPPMAETASALDIEVRSDAAPIWTPGPELTVPFFTSRNNRLCVITLLVDPGGNFAQEIVLHALGSTFLSLMKEASLSETATQFDWDMWGPEGSRMSMPAFPRSQTWVCYVYGTRYVSTGLSRRRRAGYVYMYDFNQLGLRWHKQRQEDAGGGSEATARKGAEDVDEEAEERLLCVTAPTVFEAGTIFRDEVETRLGYRVRGVAIPGEPSMLSRSAMCSEDSIILVTDIGEDDYHVLTV
ncbi:hypothetical protein AX17_000049 [Amanita inopinata Kibby_2008]|nr:hypothetical protein AX17_000049 [Amanita inopinata Kibby_2008]